MQTQRHTDHIRAEAQRLGFEFTGFARAERLDAEARRLETWLGQGAHGRMAYMENYFDMRVFISLFCAKFRRNGEVGEMGFVGGLLTFYIQQFVK